MSKVCAIKLFLSYCGVLKILRNLPLLGSLPVCLCVKLNYEKITI